MTDITTTTGLELSSTAEQLLKAAERLLAEKGLGAVSTREIARAAGQKNHSALHYHFGCRESLIEAILDYRMTPLNQHRQQRLIALRAEGRERDLRGLVEVIVWPFAEELLQPPEESYYLSLLAQLASQRDWQPLFARHPGRAAAVLETGGLLLDILKQTHSETIALERLRLLGLHVLTTITEWDAMRRRGELILNQELLQWRVENFIDYLVGGLTADS